MAEEYDDYPLSPTIHSLSGQNPAKTGHRIFREKKQSFSALTQQSI
jgi:hypothetical protein